MGIAGAPLESARNPVGRSALDPPQPWSRLGWGDDATVVHAMTGGSGDAPPVWIRIVGMMGAVYIVVYCAIGLWRNDLVVSLSKSAGNDVHLHGSLAWLCFAGSVMFAVGLAGFLAPQSGGGGFDVAARRRRFGPILLAGLALYVASQIIARWRS